MRHPSYKPADKPAKGFALHWWRLERSLGRRWREWRLPRGFERLGTRYGGWWVYAPAVGQQPLLVDCGLGVDISFPVAFLQRFGGDVVGVDPNPASLSYVEAHRPQAMRVRPEAFWSEAGRELTFHLPRPPEELPQGADGVSGSLLGSHSYAGTATRTVRTTALGEILHDAGRAECDVLKLDVEGAEYEVLAALCRSGEVRRARQLLVEYHHHCTDRTLADTERSMALVEAAGFKVAHTEDRNCVFLRNG